MKLLRQFQYDLRKNRTLLAMLVPAVVFFTLFSYVPMAGVVVAFKDWDYSLGILESPWVGFKNFEFFFQSGQAWRVTLNTIGYNLAFIVVGMTFQIALAVFLSELGGKKFKKTVQGLMILPYFISWVVVSAIAYSIFNYNFGSLNGALRSLGLEVFDFYGSPEYWPAILLAFNVWKYVGYGVVIYLAAIVSIDAEIYEAAEIDGANIWTRISKITLPFLKPTIVIMILLSIGNVFRGDFNMFYQLVGNNGMLFEATDVIDTFVFRSLLFSQEFGMSAAVGLYQSVLCFGILLFSNYVIRKVEKENALF